jgi:hypothetical protein
MGHWGQLLVLYFALDLNDAFAFLRTTSEIANRYIQHPSCLNDKPR